MNLQSIAGPQNELNLYNTTASYCRVLPNPAIFNTKIHIQQYLRSCCPDHKAKLRQIARLLRWSDRLKSQASSSRLNIPFELQGTAHFVLGLWPAVILPYWMKATRQAMLTHVTSDVGILRCGSSG